jgi:hypothetical protein
MIKGIAALGAAEVASQIGATTLNALNARWNRKFQERMSSTAVQRHTKDLQKAGWNPLLAAGGMGATTPSGSAMQVESPLKGASELVLKRKVAEAEIAAKGAAASHSAALAANERLKSDELRAISQFFKSPEGKDAVKWLKTQNSAAGAGMWFEKLLKHSADSTPASEAVKIRKEKKQFRDKAKNRSNSERARHDEWWENKKKQWKRR